jgi:hypothetical protein
MRALERRGHEIVWPSDSGELELPRVRGCDAVHVYRLAGEERRRAFLELAQRGTVVSYDNDDDYTAVPKESPQYKSTGGLTGQRIFASTVKVARAARCLTTTNDWLAKKYQRAGVEHIEVIGNYLTPGVARPRLNHEGLVVGWVAGKEHYADLTRIAIADALRRLVAQYSFVRVESIGVDLALAERYSFDGFVPFADLPGRIGGFDIGIAPLADIPMNWGRSDIKLKEYAASGVPWLASPIGPYAELGERQGGRLVADDEWFEALERLVTKPRERRRLARTAKRWAKHQTIEAAADRWEHLFTDLIA